MSGFIVNSGLSDTITSSYATVNIIDRFPKSGIQPAGSRFSVKVEVQTYGTGAFWRTPFQCLDAFVAVRGLNKYDNKILGGNFVRTFLTKNCIGETTITFDPVFTPDATSYVQFELYPGGSQEWFQDQTRLQDIINGNVEPISVSQPMRFNQSYEQGVQTGEYSTGKDAWATLPDADLQSTVRNVAILAGLGFAGYFLVLNSGAIKTISDYLAEKYTDE